MLTWVNSIVFCHVALTWNTAERSLQIFTILHLFSSQTTTIYQITYIHKTLFDIIQAFKFPTLSVMLEENGRRMSKSYRNFFASTYRSDTDWTE